MAAARAGGIRSTATTIVAAVSGEGGEDHVRSAALEIAAASGARVILYDTGAASALSDPVPNAMGADREGELYDDPLTDAQLVKLGREPLARQVADARARGVDAWGWLAEGHGSDKIVEYARRSGAGLVLLPADLGDPGLLDRMRGATADKAVREAQEGPGQIDVVLVSPDGSAEQVSGRS